jgi:Peptidase family M50
MILDVLKRFLYFGGQTTAQLLWLGAILFVSLAYDDGTPQGSAKSWEVPAAFAAATLVAVVAHELGHLLACRAVGVKVTAFRLGAERYAIRFRVQTVQLSLGLPYKGRVEYEGSSSAAGRAVITLAGSLVDLALAGAVLVGSAMAASGHSAGPVAVAVVLGFAVTGLANLLPYRSRSGRLSDGARLFELRSGGRTAQLREVQKKATRLLQTGHAEELLALHAALADPADQISTEQAVIRIAIEHNVAFLTGLPDAAAHVAARRVEMLLRHRDLGIAEAVAHQTLALVRLRRGGRDDCAAAEQHCAQALAVKNVPDSVRRLVLSAVIVSREARGLPDEDVRAAAAKLPALDDGPEVMAASLKAVLYPEALLRAFREGDPAARLGVGGISVMLLRQGRIGDLLDVHAGFGMPEGRNWQAQARSLHQIEDSLLCVPGLPPEVIDEAAVRMRWLVDNYPFNAKKDSELRPSMEHTLALARLRQGRSAEVEPLCASGLALDIGPDSRATLLATLVLARRALGQPHAELLAEAVALSPDADLVAEARSSADEPLISHDG